MSYQIGQASILRFSIYGKKNFITGEESWFVLDNGLKIAQYTNKEFAFCLVENLVNNLF